MNSFKEFVVLRDVGIEFHNREAEYEKERSYSAVLDLGTDKRPFEDDLNDRSWAIDIGFSRFVIYIGVGLKSTNYH